MSCFRFLDSNYADIDILANYDVSSEQAAFPVLNAFNGKRRAKVWRSNGQYLVSSLNNGIVFRETIATDLTASIAVGSYTRAAFLTAIKTALEVVGASTYTVTFTSGLKISIVSNGAGGGGIFELINSDVASTAASLIGFDAVDLSGSLTYVADSIRIHSDEWILFDLGIDSDPTSFALIDARNSPLTISPSATVLLQGNHTNVWTSPAYSQAISYDDRILRSISETGIAGEALRYWRIKFVDQNPKGFIQVGAFYLGNHYSTTRGQPQFPFRHEPIDRTETVYSEGGQTFSEIKPKTEKISTDWFGLTVTEKEYIEDMFGVYGLGLPLFVSFDTSATFSSSQAVWIRYVKFSSEPSFSLIRPGIWNCTIEFEEQL